MVTVVEFYNFVSDNQMSFENLHLGVEILGVNISTKKYETIPEELFQNLKLFLYKLL